MKWGWGKERPKIRWITHYKKPYETKPVPIVADGAIAMPVFGEGRLIPILILDTTERPDLEELIRVHKALPPGDVDVQWGQLEGRPENIALFLTFKRPIPLFTILEFDIVSRGGVVDQIMRAGGVYLQAGRNDDRVKDTIPAEKLTVEIPDTGVRSMWDEKFHRAISRHLRREHGYGRQEAKRVARTYIDEWRKFGDFRMRPKWPAGE